VPANLPRSILNTTIEELWILNAELTKKALEKVGNPNVLINLVSRRVRQLNVGAGAMSRPLVADTGNLGAADIALLEIVEGKVGFEMPEPVELTRPSAKRRGRKR
jgi:DNA-directed RNA polymerase subunit omega